jgi:hypothetical protein
MVLLVLASVPAFGASGDKVEVKRMIINKDCELQWEPNQNAWELPNIIEWQYKSRNSVSRLRTATPLGLP